MDWRGRPTASSSMVLKAGCDGWIRASRCSGPAVPAESGAGRSHLAVVTGGWPDAAHAAADFPKDLVTVCRSLVLSAVAPSLLLPAVDPPRTACVIPTNCRDRPVMPGWSGPPASVDWTLTLGPLVIDRPQLYWACGRPLWCSL